jgi:hypothetical protein
MKTVTDSAFRGSGISRHAVTLLMAWLATLSASAVNPPADITPPPSIAADDVDPYLAYLESLDSRDAACHEHSATLRSLLTERERLARTFLDAAPAVRADLIGAMEALDQRIEEAETALENGLARSEPGDAPGLAPLPVVDVQALRKQSQRWRKPIYPPVPPPLVIPELPVTAGEAAYLDYLLVRAGDSTFAQALVADVASLLHERRELAYRHAHSRALERARLEGTIRAVSLHVRISARAVAEGIPVGGW